MRLFKIAALLCFLLASVAMLWHAFDKAPTYDEIGHLQSGFYHWRHHDMERGIEHPPLIRLFAGLPLNFMDLSDPQDSYPSLRARPLSVMKEQLYGTILLYRNHKYNSEQILIPARIIMIIVTLLLMALIYQWSKELYGRGAGLFSLFLAATFSPILGHGTLVNTDVGGVACALLFMYSLYQYLEKPSLARLLYCGFTLGLALASKLSNLILIPISCLMTVVYPGVQGKNSWKRIVAYLSILCLGMIFLNSSYRFQNVWPPHQIHPNDLLAYNWSPLTQAIYRYIPLPDFYLMSVGFMLYHVQTGFTTFLLGQVYSQGVWYYFPVIFLLRTPTLALFTIFTALFSLAKFKLERKEFFLIFPPACYFILTLFSHLNLGIRHLLFIYPFLLIFSGRIYVPYIAKAPKFLLIGGLLFHGVEMAVGAPHYLAFYNLLCGGPSLGIKYTSDLDYGQDLKNLGKFMKERPGAELILSYFGTALPEAYGLDPQDFFSSGTLFKSQKINSPEPSREFLAVSVSQIQGLKFGQEALKWLNTRKPEKILGYSIYIYNITEDKEAHEKLAEIYEQQGESEKAQRELARAKVLS